jgi:hypothetical protein
MMSAGEPKRNETRLPAPAITLFDGNEKKNGIVNLPQNIDTADSLVLLSDPSVRLQGN